MAPRKELGEPFSSLPASVATLAQAARRRQHLERREIEHALRVRMIAVLRVVSGHEQEIADAEQRGAEQIRLDGDAVAIPRRHLDDRLDPALDEESRDRLWLNGHAGPR